MFLDLESDCYLTLFAAGPWQTLQHTNARTARKSLRFVAFPLSFIIINIIVIVILIVTIIIININTIIVIIQGVSHVFDTLAGVEAAQLQTVLVQAEEVLSLFVCICICICVCVCVCILSCKPRRFLPIILFFC